MYNYSFTEKGMAEFITILAQARYDMHIARRMPLLFCCIGVAATLSFFYNITPKNTMYYITCILYLICIIMPLVLYFKTRKSKKYFIDQASKQLYEALFKAKANSEIEEMISQDCEEI